MSRGLDDEATKERVTVAAGGHPVGTAATMIELGAVCKTFPSKRGGRETKALDDISFDIQEGEFVSIIGPSGCGKTTLLRIIAGLAKPDAGTAKLDGTRIVGPSPNAAVVFQQPALLPWAPVVDNVGIGMRFRGVSRSDWEPRAMEMIRLMGLADFALHLPHTLSGGMQQRVALARALVLDPPLLLLDEPFGSLDEITRRRLNRELLDIWRTQGRTAVFITHNVSEAVILSDRIVVMSPRPGRVAEIVDVSLPRPRSLSHEGTSEFVATHKHIWSLIEEWDT